MDFGRRCLCGTISYQSFYPSLSPKLIQSEGLLARCPGDAGGHRVSPTLGRGAYSNVIPFKYMVRSCLILLSLPAGGHFVPKRCNPGLSSYLIRIKEMPELSRKCSAEFRQTSVTSRFPHLDLGNPQVNSQLHLCC